jgi:hypothetical protein
MTDAQKQTLLDAAKILKELKDAEGVETISIPVLFGVLSFSQ